MFDCLTISEAVALYNKFKGWHHDVNACIQFCRQIGDIERANQAREMRNEFVELAKDIVRAYFDLAAAGC